MADLTISIRDNGPYRIKGPVLVADAEGNTYEQKEGIALCRCGHSANKPFCDGAHAREGFASAPRVPRA